MKPKVLGVQQVAALGLALIVGSASLVSGQPPTEAVPPDVALDQISLDIERLTQLNVLRLDVKQLTQMLPVAEQLERACKQIEKDHNLAGTKSAMWQVRMKLLMEEPGDPWLPMASFWEKSEQREKAFNEELAKAVGQLKQLLSEEQQKTLARRGTAWGRMDECLEGLEAGFKLEEDEWRSWRDQTASTLAQVAAEISPDTAKGVSDRVLLVLISAREKGPDYVKGNLVQLRSQLLAATLPENKRDGPFAEEREERIRGALSDLLKDAQGRALLKEKLEAKKARG